MKKGVWALGIVIVFAVLIITGLKFGTGISLGSMTARYGECNLATCYGFVYNHNCIGFIGPHTLMGCVSPSQVDCMRIDLVINSADYDNATKTLNVTVIRADGESSIILKGTVVLADGKMVKKSAEDEAFKALDARSYSIPLISKPAKVKVAGILESDYICPGTTEKQIE